MNAWNECAYHICLLSPAGWLQNHVLLFCWLWCSSNRPNLQVRTHGRVSMLLVGSRTRTAVALLARTRRESSSAHCISSSPTSKVCGLYLCTQTFYVTVHEVLPCSVYPVTISFLQQWYSFYYSFFSVKEFKMGRKNIPLSASGRQNSVSCHLTWDLKPPTIIFNCDERKFRPTVVYSFFISIPYFFSYGREEVWYFTYSTIDLFQNNVFLPML